ncbi:cell fate (sporulation/competence/biofilm development) regulator YmcA (YheA/YmcA/DUF963 family) [Bacillus fengqiuensis]|nr:cell fate (sporulation/competence/biofilm development) regulator YmcA (YheA/YmcA/DUF963 family) [Bacillus fengqiuensis]
MSNQNKRLDEALVDRLDNVYSHLGVQMAAPFYILSNVFLTAGNLSTDVVGLMRKKASNKYEREMFAIRTSEMPPEVYSFLEQKMQANELRDYITKLVEQDLYKPDKEEDDRTLFDSLRDEFLSEINLLKKELALRPVAADYNGLKSAQANELRDYVTKLVEQDLRNPDKEELRALFDSLRNEFLDEINSLKKELALRPVAANYNESRPVIDHEEVDDFKEGQLLENDRVTGTIKEIIDVDF